MFATLGIDWEALRHCLEDWAPLAEWAVAAGTLLLAIGTGLLAAATFRLAQRAKEESQTIAEEVTIERLALEATSRPILVAAESPDLCVLDAKEAKMATVPLCNIGTGPALMQATALDAGALGRITGTYSQGIVQPGGEMSYLDFDLPESPEWLAKVDTLNTFSIVASYTDVAGGQPTRTRLDVHYVEGELGWFVRQVFLLRRRRRAFCFDRTRGVGSTRPWRDSPISP
jgi:hypothetical protein